MTIDIRAAPDDAPDQYDEAPDQSPLEQRLDELENKAADAGALDELAGKIDRLETRLARPNARVEVREDDAALERKAWTQFLQRGWDGVGELERKILTVSVGSPDSGGWATVPEQFLNEILKDLVELSPMRQVARVQQVGGGPVLIPRRTSTLSAAWVAEAAEHGLSEPTYDQVSVDLFEARVTSEISNQLLEDSAFDLGGEIGRDLAEQFAFLEGEAFVDGNGTTEPEGFLTSGDFVSSGTAIDADGAIDLLHSVATPYANNGVWLMNRSSMGVIRKLTDGAGGYIWAESIAPGNPPTILGRPVVEMPKMPSTGGTAVAFGDWSQAYRIFDRIQLQVLRDPYSAARNSVVQFHARRRVGGALIKSEAVAGMTVT